MRLSPGTRVGPYVIESLLGVGGMGEVYRARDERLHRAVALKFPPATREASADDSRRLVREARAAAALDHPYICEIFEVGEADGLAYIAMECVSGTTLRDKLRQGRLPLKTAVRLALEIGEALDTAHRAGVVHRDLKPSNVIVGDDGHAKVLDFGLAARVATPLDAQAATLTQSHPGEGKLTGTPSYMAPEQLRGETADARSDIFAFGIVLYEMVTGQHPFRGATLFDVSHAILSDDPITWPPESAQPALLQHIVQKALAKDREARYQSMREVVTDLQAVAGSSQNTGAAIVAQSATRSRPGWPRWAFAFVATTAVVSGVVYWLRQDAAPPSAAPMQRSQVTSSGNVLAAAISPDGKQVAYVTMEGRETATFVRDLAGDSALEIARTDLPVFGLQWSPNGGHVVITRLGETHMVPRLGGQPRRIPRSGRFVAWSPDGARMATGDQGFPAVFVQGVSGSEQPLRIAIPGASINSLAWSKVANVLVVVATEGASIRSLWLLTPDGASVRRTPLDRDVVGCVPAPIRAGCTARSLATTKLH